MGAHPCRRRLSIFRLGRHDHNGEETSPHRERSLQSPTRRISGPTWIRQPARKSEETGMRNRSAISAAILASLAFAASAYASDLKTVSIIVMNDTPQLLEVKQGLIEGLAKHGYMDGKN